MNVLYLLSATHMGGATLSALTLIKGLKERGFNVTAVIPNADPAFEKLLADITGKHYIVGMSFRAYPRLNCFADYVKWGYRLVKMLVRQAVSSKQLQRIIRDERIDLVHTNVGPLVCGYDACRKLGVPHVWHIREYGKPDFNIRMFPSRDDFRKHLRNSYVITITNALLEYNRLDGHPGARVVYNGVRSKYDTRLSGRREDYFLCASRVSPEKGFEQTIRTFARFHSANPGYRLRIMGLYKPDYKTKLCGLADALGVGSAVLFEDYTSNISQYMSEARALLVASPNEGFGRMTAEAAFAGCLVIGKNTAGTKEIMDITGGFRFITDDEMLDAMTAVSRLSEDEYLRMASASQREAVSFFSEEEYLERVSGIYESAVAGVSPAVRR